ncbi:hypothetical protein [Nitrosospira sp. Nsp13]|uniref:hypothetical protein n=1 Tax=Nitrosospira sp. Nsp13 TaxID=1855332 RepID=UPI00088B4170|nr:hypothetical protein [Nitrosospira sp. Nsp13]SCX87653.1 hypothetical protein SAMN05216308_101678 [Nitrosospira sp. Nsp13]
MENDNDFLGDVLWKMYQEHCVQGRHHETQRSTVASTLIAIAGVAIGFITYDGNLSYQDLPLTLFLLLLGAFGAIFSAKQYERFSLHMTRARKHRDALDALLPQSPLKRLKTTADSEHNIAFPKLKTLRLHQFWLWLYLLIAVLGVLLSFIAIANPNDFSADISPQVLSTIRCLQHLK